MFDSSLFIKGATVGVSLIMAIGAQNAFVLKQGLLRQHIGWVCLICFLCDLVLISIGVFGLGSLISQSPMLSIGLAGAGAVFLFTYAARSFYQAFKSNSTMDVSTISGAGSSTIPARTIIATTLAITLLNPHVYLDTVVIIGGIAGTLPAHGKVSFLLGTCIASGIWFYSLGYGARYLRPLFKNPKSWRILEFFVGCLMVWIAWGLVRFIRNSLG